MRKNPAESRAFGEGVKYGEELELNPDERRKLDREHESEGMKKAMDACGLDAENPQESKAFAEASSTVRSGSGTPRNGASLTGNTNPRANAANSARTRTRTRPSSASLLPSPTSRRSRKRS